MFAFVFESVGSGEWLVLLAVILIVVGPKNLPAAARKMGQVMSKLRRAADEFKRQLMTMDEEMKKTADDIKRDYIDIPEDSPSDKAVSEDGGSDDPSSEEYYDGHDEYPDDYPDADYYGATDENGLEVQSGPDGEQKTPEQDAPAAAEGGQDATVTASPETPERTNGQDKGNTQGS